MSIFLGTVPIGCAYRDPCSGVFFYPIPFEQLFSWLLNLALISLPSYIYCFYASHVFPFIFFPIIPHCSKSAPLAFVQHIDQVGQRRGPTPLFKTFENWKNILNHLKNSINLKCLWTVFCYQLCIGIPKWICFSVSLNFASIHDY